MIIMEHNIHTMPFDQLDLLVHQATAAAAKESAAIRRPITPVEPLVTDLETETAKQPSGSQSVTAKPSSD